MRFTITSTLTVGFHDSRTKRAPGRGSRWKTAIGVTSVTMLPEAVTKSGFSTSTQVTKRIIALRAELGQNLDSRATWSWIMHDYGMVNSAPGFERQFAVIDGVSDLFYELWGPEYGKHVRAAVGIAELPRRSVLEIMGEFELNAKAEPPRPPRKAKTKNRRKPRSRG